MNKDIKIHFTEFGIEVHCVGLSKGDIDDIIAQLEEIKELGKFE